MKKYRIVSIWFLILISIVGSVLTAIEIGAQTLLHRWHEFSEACTTIVLRGWSFFTVPTTFVTIILLLILSGGVMVMIWRGVCEFRNIRKMNKEVSQKILYEKKQVSIIDQQEFMAFSSGFFHPRIFISRGAIECLNEQELQALLAHERYHQKYFHSLIRLCIQMLSSLFFFIPGVKKMAEYVRMQHEFKADDAAIKVTSRQTLAGMLLRMHTDGEYAATIAGFAALSSRAERLMYPEKRIISRWSVGMFVVGCMSVLGGVVMLLSQIHPARADVGSNYPDTSRCNAILKSSIAPEFFSREIRSTALTPERSSAFDSIHK